MQIPDFELTHGQALFALNLGHKPDRVLVNQLRHLRRLNLPFEDGEGRGQGNQVRYDFDHLIETGAAMFALRNHMPPRHIAEWFEKERKRFRRTCRDAWRDLPDAALKQDSLAKRGVGVRGDEIYLRLHDRHSEKPGAFDFARGSDLVDVLKEGFAGERFDDKQFRPLLALKDNMLKWVYWAKKAPAIRTGPK